MGLQLRHQVQLYDYAFPYAYARIAGFDFTRSLQFEVYAGRAARELGREPLEHIAFELTNAEVQRLRTEFLAGIYRVLKERPEFQGLAEV